MRTTLADCNELSINSFKLVYLIVLVYYELYLEENIAYYAEKQLLVE